MLEKIETMDQFEEVLNKEHTFFLLKHSLTCPISHAAYKEYEKYAENHQDVPTYYLAVQDSRPLSNAIAENFSIKHESPQAILFVEKQAKWSATHWKITKRSLSEATTKDQ